MRVYGKKKKTPNTADAIIVELVRIKDTRLYCTGPSCSRGRRTGGKIPAALPSVSVKNHTENVCETVFRGFFFVSFIFVGVVRIKASKYYWNHANAVFGTSPVKRKWEFRRQQPTFFSQGFFSMLFTTISVLRDWSEKHRSVHIPKSTPRQRNWKHNFYIRITEVSI